MTGGASERGGGTATRDDEGAWGRGGGTATRDDGEGAFDLNIDGDSYICK